MQINEIIIDKRFRDKIPPLSEDEFNRLRENILADGEVRDSLIVWQEEKILLDGHNRYRIIQENPDLPYTIKEKSFSDEWSATIWVCKNQLGRRNVNDKQRDKLIQEEYEAMQKVRGGDHKSEDFKNQSGESHHFDTTSKTRARIAEEHGITQHAVKVAVEFGRGLDKADEIVPGFKEEVLAEKVKAGKYDVAAMRNMEPEQIEEAVKSIRNGEKPKKAETYVQPVELIKIGSSDYNTEDFEEQVKSFSKELDDSIRLFLEVHGDMLSNAKCRLAFRLMLRDIDNVTKKYKEAMKSEY